MHLSSYLPSPPPSLFCPHHLLSLFSPLTRSFSLAPLCPLSNFLFSFILPPSLVLTGLCCGVSALRFSEITCQSKRGAQCCDCIFFVDEALVSYVAHFSLFDKTRSWKKMHSPWKQNRSRRLHHWLWMADLLATPRYRQNHSNKTM